MENKKRFDLLITNAIKESNNFLDIYYLELNYHKKQLNSLEENKPLKFMKKKYASYEEEKKSILRDIEKCNKKIREEQELLEKLIKSLDIPK